MPTLHSWIAVKALLLPAVLAALRRVRPRDAAWEWEYVPEGWERSRRGGIKGWNVATVCGAQRRRWPEFVRMTQQGTVGCSSEVCDANVILGQLPCGPLLTSHFSGLRLVRVFLIDPRRTVEDGPESPQYRGFLFEVQARTG